MSATHPVTSAHSGTNADLIAEVCRLYAPPGARIADVTYGTGRFWRKTDLAGYTFLASDLEPQAPGVLAADFTALPYADGCMDVVVLDPPYVHSPGRRADRGQYAATTTRYNSRATIAGQYHGDIMSLYRDGMAEAFRVLRPDGGQLWVKCKDQVQREVQCWSLLDIHQMAAELGFCARDLFVLTGATAPDRWPGRIQRHARKTHSYLWVFTRPDARYAKLLARPRPHGAPRHVSARRAKVAALAAGGASQRAIARELGVSQSTVRDDVRAAGT